MLISDASKRRGFPRDNVIRFYTMFSESRFLGKFLFNRFSVLSETGNKFPFGLPDVELVAIFTWNGINYTAYLIFWHRVFGLGE